MVNELERAAESYAISRLAELALNPHWLSQPQLLIEIAFMSGATWFQKNQIDEMRSELNDMREEITNAQS